MTMHWGYNTNGFAHHRLEDALTILAELGYQSVALTLDHAALDPFGPRVRAEARHIKRMLQRLSLHCVVETGARFLLDSRRKHQPTLLSDDPAGRFRRLDFLSRAVEIAAWLEADAVSFWSGAADTGAADAALWQRLSDACARLCDQATARGVRLAFEPEPGMFIDTMAQFAKLHALVKHRAFGLTLDVGHLHCLGEGAIDVHVQRWKDCLWNVHIEDMRRGVHDHLMFGDGDMDFPPILRALTQIQYAGGIHVELSRHSHDAVRTAEMSLAFLRQAAEI